MVYHNLCSYITGGSFFTYKGVRYGKGTQIRFTEEFYKRIEKPTQFSFSKRKDHFESITIENGKEIWHVWNSGDLKDVIPDRDIYNIVYPVYYYEPKELARQRLQNGTWFDYVWKQTLFYAACLLISPLFKEWYLIWTIGLYAYLRLCYIALSKP